MGEFLWYIPNTVEAGVRGDDVASGWADLERSVTLARMTEDHGWGGALFGTSWGRPDTFTVATAIAARTTTFQPLIAIRPGYWRPAHFASNLGVVELCLALHLSFDFAHDRLIWDTGHQIYPHKLATGRFPQFDTIRTRPALAKRDWIPLAARALVGA